MRIPIIVKQAITLKRVSSRSKRNVGSEGEFYIPSYKEMRQAKIHPEMSDKERWAYRGKKIQSGYIRDSAIGGVLGGAAGVGAGRGLQLMKVLPSNRFGYAVKNWVLPASIGVAAYRVGSNLGKIRGERKARKQLNESGNPIKYVNPLSLTDRGMFDPTFLGTLFGVKSLQAAASDKTRKAVEAGVEKAYDIHKGQGLRNAAKGMFGGKIKMPRIFGR